MLWGYKRSMKFSSSAAGFARALLAGALTLVASGWGAIPAAAQTSPLPSYASGDESIRGRIAAIDGKYQLQLHDDRGFIDKVSLHDGTIINPTGLRLAPGQSVTIHGHTAGKTFEANEIDTAYANYGVPAYGPYAYPYYGYAYPYGPYPVFGLGFRSSGFGFRGWF